MIARAALALLLAATPAFADGPALAYFTLEGRTQTLTADASVTTPEMIRHDGDQLHLLFAQLHLGFPTAPFLRVTLQESGGTWQVRALSFEDTSAVPPVVFALDSLRVVHASGGPDDLHLTLEGEAMVPNAPPQPVRLEITLRSP